MSVLIMHNGLFPESSAPLHLRGALISKDDLLMWEGRLWFACYKTILVDKPNLSERFSF